MNISALDGASAFRSDVGGGFVDILEEYDENSGATDVELEQGPDSEPDSCGGVRENIENPWDPRRIRVGTKSFSLRNMLDQIDEGSLEMAPDFQRLKVWKPRQKARLIESLLLQIPLPAFYFTEEHDSSMRVVDGLQRLSAVREFVRGEPDGSGGFALTELEYLSDAEGKRFEELSPVWQRRIHNAQIVVHVIDPRTPKRVKYDIFKRINTGGTPLNAQEIRHCMSKTRSRDFLKECVESPQFAECTGNALAKQCRMVDREVVLRFMAFSLLDAISDYHEYGSMEEMLWKTTERLDDPDDVTDEQLTQLREGLFQGLELSELVFGEHAFRKHTHNSNRRSPFNRALFETWTYGLAARNPAEVENAATGISEIARARMSEDADYMSAITVSTSTLRKVEYRFSVVAEILDEALT